LQYYIRQIESQKGEPVPESLHIQAIFFTDGITALYTNWLQKKIKVTPQQLVDIAFQCMPVEMARYFL